MPPQDFQTVRPIGAAASANRSGSGMDRVIERPKRPWLRWGGIAAGVIVAIVAAGYLLDDLGTRTLSMDGSRVVISNVTRGVFEDYVPIRGQVTPRRTIYLDVIEGGRVEQRLVEDGVEVEAGQLLVVLSNTAMQLDVTRNEAMVTEQLNNMRTIELQLEQNRLAHRRNLVELDYNILRLSRRVERLSNLDVAGVAIKGELEDSQDELEYLQRRREVTLESQATDTRLQETQLEFLATSGRQLEESLQLARRNLEALSVRAPVSGKLSGFDVEIGQSVQRGGRLGQIDDPDGFKLAVQVDEFYLGRVALGLPASFERGGEQYDLSISKIYPQVNNGQFSFDLRFDAEEPTDIRRGQTLQATLTLGDPTPALLIPNGAFYQDTGGNWMFVLSEDGTEAVKRPVRLGRRNARFIEVLDGLEAGERVITSPYSSYRDMERLSLNDE